LLNDVHINKKGGKMKITFTKLKMLYFLCIILTLSFIEIGYTEDVEIEKFPDRPITLIYPTPPGNPGELAARLISKEAEKFLGKPIVILNKPGAALTIGTAAIAAAKPDGYTIGYVGGPPLFITPFLEKVPYDAIRDFRMIIQYEDTNFGEIGRAHV
jgi:tripartite-type tricarboxylate transporter receptor subunit TctC